MLGVFLSIIPLANFAACGYLYRLFAQGREQVDISLPEWGDWKGLLIDGLKFFLIFLIFACIPVGLMAGLVSILPWNSDSFLAKIPMAPAYFVAGPLFSAALYLYLLSGDFKACFNFSGLSAILKKALPHYWVPTLAFLGILLMMPFTFFFGGVIYFYLMGYIFKNLEKKADKR